MSTEDSLETAVARFVAGFGPDDIDAPARAGAISLIKDQLAIQLGAARLPWSRQLRAARALRPGPCSLVGEAGGVAAADAAYLNASYGHGFEYDDYAGNAHPGCCVVPVALAVGEETGAKLGEVLTAMVAGYETYVRIGRLASPALLNAGWQPHAVLANFGAAAVAAKLHGLDAGRTGQALAIALSHAGGTTEYASTGGSVKRAHAGIAARNGIEAVDLARAGITGPRRYLTGSRGLYRNFAGRSVPQDSERDFRRDAPLCIGQPSFKAYCCCAATHAYIEAMAAISGPVSDIEAVQARVQTMTDVIVGNQNAHIYAPRNIEELQYSLPVQMALAALGYGNGYRTHLDYLEGRLQLEGAVLTLARRIALTVDPALDQAHPRGFVADVRVRYRDGRQERLFIDKVLGRPDKPFSRRQHQDKLDDLSHDVLGAARAAEMFALIDALPSDLPVSSLTEFLRGR